MKGLMLLLIELDQEYFPVGAKSPKKQSVGVFLTTWHCILGAELTKNVLLQTVVLTNSPTRLHQNRVLLLITHFGAK